MKTRRNVNIQVRDGAGRVFWWCLPVKAQSDCEAQHSAKANAERNGCVVVRFGSVTK